MGPKVAMIAALLVGVAVLSAAPAGAHDVSSLLTNYQTRLLAVDPAIDGVEIDVIEDGNRMEAVNETDTELVVLGYEDEPYLRIGPDGVFQNLNSGATYLNEERDGDIAVPERVDPDADPEWDQVGAEPVARWHDHRVHWMSPNDAPQVQDAPDEEHLVQEWEVPMVYGDEPVSVTGDLRWIPAPSPAPWAVLVLALAGGLAAT